MTNPLPAARALLALPDAATDAELEAACRDYLTPFHHEGGFLCVKHSLSVYIRGSDPICVQGETRLEALARAVLAVAERLDAPAYATPTAKESQDGK